MPAQRLRSVNGVAVKSKLAKKILPTLVYRNCHVHTGTVFTEPKLRRIHDSVEITLVNIITVDQIGTLLHIRGDKRQRRLQPRVPFPCRTDRVFEELAGGDVSIADEINRGELSLRSFGHVEHET